MISRLRILPLLACLFAYSVFAGDAGVHPSTEALRNWPQWRGPLANGVAPLANPPIHWSEPSVSDPPPLQTSPSLLPERLRDSEGERVKSNVRWKIELPGEGHASPIVFGDSVYVLATVPVGEAQQAVHDDAPMGKPPALPEDSQCSTFPSGLWSVEDRTERFPSPQQFVHSPGPSPGALAPPSPAPAGEGKWPSPQGERTAAGPA